MARGYWKQFQENPKVFVKDHIEVTYTVIFFIFFILGWEFTVRYFKVPAFLIPPPSKVAFAMWNGLATPLFAREGFYVHTAYTFLEAMLGFVGGSLFGLLVGTAISQFKVVEKTLLPFIVAFQTLPKVAIAPLFVVWFGFGLTSKVLMSALLTFFPLLVNAIAGFKSVEEDKINLMRSLSASRWKIFRIVQVPTALPYLFAGLEMGIVFCIIGAVVGEFVGAQTGLGVLILQMNFSMDIAGAFSVLVLLSVMGLVLHTIVVKIRKKVIFWAPEEKATIGV